MKSTRNYNMSALLATLINTPKYISTVNDFRTESRSKAKRSSPLSEKLKANAAAKRERKANHAWHCDRRCKWGNPCLKATGKNFLTAE